jgi:hypothetical protein
MMAATESPRCSACGSPLLAAGDVVFPQDGGAVHPWCRDRGARGAELVRLMCVLCQIPLVAGEHLLYDGTGLVHPECHARASAGGAVGDFLKAEAGRAFCHSCLAAQLGLRWDTVRKSIWALRVSPAFQVRAGTCVQCGAPRVVVLAADAHRPARTR